MVLVHLLLRASGDCRLGGWAKGFRVWGWGSRFKGMVGLKALGFHVGGLRGGFPVSAAALEVMACRRIFCSAAQLVTKNVCEQRACAAR